MSYTTALTNAIRTVRGEHRCYSPGCYLMEVGGQEILDGSSSGVPGGLVSPVRYQMVKDDKRLITYLVCDKIRVRYRTLGNFHEEKNYEHSAILVYRFSGNDIPSLYIYPTNSDCKDYTLIPKPNEDGEYLIPEPGSMTKCCRN